MGSAANRRVFCQSMVRASVQLIVFQVFQYSRESYRLSAFTFVHGCAGAGALHSPPEKRHVRRVPASRCCAGMCSNKSSYLQVLAGTSVRRRRQLWVFAAKKVGSHLARRSYRKPSALWHVLACLCSRVQVCHYWGRTMLFEM